MRDVETREFDLVVVESDGTKVVVEAKKPSDGRTVRHGIPKSTLDVMFTSDGIIELSGEKTVAGRIIGGDPLATHSPAQARRGKRGRMLAVEVVDDELPDDGLVHRVRARDLPRFVAKSLRRRDDAVIRISVGTREYKK